MILAGHDYRLEFIGSEIDGFTGDEANNYIVEHWGVPGIEVIHVTYNSAIRSAILLPNYDLTTTGNRRVAMFQYNIAADAAVTESTRYYIGFVEKINNEWTLQNFMSLQVSTCIYYVNNTTQTIGTDHNENGNTAFIRIASNAVNIITLYTLPNSKGYLIGIHNGTWSNNVGYSAIEISPNTMVYAANSVKHSMLIPSILSLSAPKKVESSYQGGKKGILVDDVTPSLQIGTEWDRVFRERTSTDRLFYLIEDTVVNMRKLIIAEYYYDDVYYINNYNTAFRNFSQLTKCDGKPYIDGIRYNNETYIITATNGIETSEHIVIKKT